MAGAPKKHLQTVVEICVKKINGMQYRLEAKNVNILYMLMQENKQNKINK